MESEVEQTNAPVAAPYAAPATPPPTTVDDLTALFAEYEAGTKPPQPETVETQPDASPQNAVTAPDQNLTDPTQAALDSRVQDVWRQRVDHLWAHVRQQADQSEFDRVVGAGNELLKSSGLAVSEDYARRWLLAEARLNPQIAEAFDNRHQSPAHEHFYKRQEQKALLRLLDAAKREPDPIATGDRMAVTAAMRGTVSRMPDRPAPRYGDMTDAEFNAEKKKHGL